MFAVARGGVLPTSTLILKTILAQELTNKGMLLVMLKSKSPLTGDVRGSPGDVSSPLRD